MRQQLTTAQRGYGQAHRNLAARLLAAWKPGDPCARCGQPMLYRWTTDARGRKVSAIDLGHLDGTGKTAYAGLEHRHCNRAAGARQVNARRKSRRRRFTTSRAW